MQQQAPGTHDAGDKQKRERIPKKKKPSAAQPKAKRARTSLRGVHALVVDDDAASAKLAAVLLRGEGCDVRVTGSAEEALAAIAVRVPDLIVLDLVLPLMSGLLFAQTVTSQPTMRDTVIVVVSAVNGPETELLVREAGCAAYLRKPIDPLMLADVALQQLRGKK
jgi:CheY-like chemotaxis protein